MAKIKPGEKITIEHLQGYKKPKNIVQSNRDITDDTFTWNKPTGRMLDATASKPLTTEFDNR